MLFISQLLLYIFNLLFQQNFFHPVVKPMCYNYKKIFCKIKFPVICHIIPSPLRGEGRVRVIVIARSEATQQSQW